MFLSRDTKLVTDRTARAVCRVAGCALLTFAASCADAATPAPIDLNQFDTLKKSVALPDGETLAYVPLGNPAGAPSPIQRPLVPSPKTILPLAFGAATPTPTPPATLKSPN